MDAARRGRKLREGSITGISKFDNAANDIVIGSSTKF